MRKSIYKGSYLIALSIAFGYLVLAQQTRGRPSYGVIPVHMAVFEQGKPIIYSATEGYDTEQDVFSGITFVALPRRSSGPLRYGFTFYHTTSYLSDINDVSITDYGEHTELEIQVAFEALQLYTQSIPEYQHFRPGEPPRTVIDRPQAVRCGVGFISVLVLPGLIAFLFCFIFRVNSGLHTIAG